LLLIMESINYGGWPNCCRLANALVEVVVTADVGPRIIRFGFVGEANEFKEYPEMLGQVGGDEWRIYGGHRLWHAPEVYPRTHQPDNRPVRLEPLAGGVRLIQAVEELTGLQKEMDVCLAPEAAQVTVTHRLRNTNVWAVKLAPWALSVMAPGGQAIVPLPPRAPHGTGRDYTPSNTLALWPCTAMADPRWIWGNQYVLLRQEAERDEGQKLGLLVPAGWAAYARAGHLFIKRFDFLPGACYPDAGCNVELFANAAMLELESLGPLVTLRPGAATDYVEQWFLARDVPQPATEAEVDAFVLPSVAASGAV
jgi:hypothetical protein